MATQPGATTWMNRSIDRGGKTMYYTPKTLIDMYKEYYLYNQKNPIIKKVLGTKNEIIDLPVDRPLSIKAFCLFAGISQSTFYQYAKDIDFIDVCNIIRDSVYTQKFELATVGVFNATIIVRDLGLNDVTVNVLDDRRKSVDELFPSEEELDKARISGRTIEETKLLNSSYGETSEPELRVSSSDSEGEN